MTLDVIFCLLAVICFAADLLGKADGKGVPAGLIFLTLLIAF